MNTKIQTEKRMKLENTLGNFIKSSKWYFLIAIIIIIVVVAVFVVRNRVNSQKADASAIKLEEIQTQYDAYTSEKSASENDESVEITINVDDVVKSIDEFVTEYPKSTDAQRAMFMKADILFSEEKWQEAHDVYIELTKMFPEGYLKPGSQFNAAVCLEEMDDLAGAVELYTLIYANDSVSTPLKPHAIFSVGRIYEDLGSAEMAEAAYTKLLDEYATSSWANFAKTRIIYLQSNK